MWLILTVLVLFLFYYLCKVELSLLSQSSLFLFCFYYQSLRVTSLVIHCYFRPAALKGVQHLIFIITCLKIFASWHLVKRVLTLQCIFSHGLSEIQKYFNQNVLFEA